VTHLQAVLAGDFRTVIIRRSECRERNVIKAEKIFANQGYLLSCTAVPLEKGGFHAQVQITRYSDKADMGTTWFTPELAYSTRAIAIEHARAWSVEWVKNNG
jgi:hypothetical protein